MTTIGTATLELIADVGRFTTDLREANREWLTVAGKMEEVGRSLTARLTLPLTLAGGAALKLASDAVETANKFDVVMGPAAARMREQLGALTDTIPLTRSEMEGLASGVQDMLVPMGLAREEAAQFSVDMVRLAGDLASFNNTSPEEALRAIQSALAGSSEPMRRFGVDTRVTRLEQIALEEGIIEAGQAMDNQSTALAVMAAIQRDSTDAMGDAARTAGDFAQQTRFVYRELREVGITIGQIVMPAVLPFIRAAGDLLRGFQQLPGPVQTTVVAMAAMAAAVGPLILATSSLIRGFIALRAAIVATNIALATGPLALIAAGAGLVTGLFLLGRNARQAADGMEALGQADTRSLQQLEADLESARARMVEFQRLSQNSGPRGERYAAQAREAFNEVVRLQGAIQRLQALSGPPPVLQETANAATAAADAVGERWGLLVQEVGIVGQDLMSALVEPVTMMGEVVVSRTRDMAQRSIAELQFMVVAYEQAVQLVTNAAGSLLDGIIGWATGAQNAIRNAVNQIIADIARMVARLLLAKALVALFPGSDFAGAVAFSLSGGAVGKRAAGGPVRANAPYMVGERGPELFVPHSAGRIVANGAMGGTLTVDMSMLPPPPRVVSPDAVATDDWWRRAFGALSLDYRERGGL